MLPFLNPKKAVGVIVSRRGKGDIQDAAMEVEAPENKKIDPGVEAAAHSLLRAIDERSVKSVARALHEIFEIMESLPHHEGEHISEEAEEASEGEA